VLHYVASDQPVTPWTPAGIAASDRHWAWLEETLRKAASTADYIIVAGHYPVWSVGGHGPIDALVVRGGHQPAFSEMATVQFRLSILAILLAAPSCYGLDSCKQAH